LFLTDVNEKRYLYRINRAIKKPAPHIADGCKIGFANARIAMNGIKRIPKTLLIMKTTNI
jgi:hypothetical protein